MFEDFFFFSSLFFSENLMQILLGVDAYFNVTVCLKVFWNVLVNSYIFRQVKLSHKILMKHFLFVSIKTRSTSFPFLRVISRMLESLVL